MIDYGYGVWLTSLESKDIEKLRQWRNDPSIWKWCRQTDLISDTQQEKWFASQDADPAIHMYTIWTSKTDMLIGACGFTSHDRLNRIAEFSLYIAPENQGDGLGRMALKTLIAYGFKNFNLHSIWGESFTGNPAMKTFEELGFKPDGIRRQCYYKDGKYLDSHLYSILENEWTP